MLLEQILGLRSCGQVEIRFVLEVYEGNGSITFGQMSRFTWFEMGNDFRSFDFAWQLHRLPCIHSTVRHYGCMLSKTGLSWRVFVTSSTVNSPDRYYCVVDEFHSTLNSLLILVGWLFCFVSVAK